ncbi:3-oxoacyl-ACP reductase [Actinospica robiniae]|uniref:3-oxoacyl-ACP reductase n=1 Tax=Actinospica robiniae TaxID=304901 RepID=UPI0004152E9C|nr:3-oxoacyl-ACP reductase [Actinospica robiniae]
MADRYQKFTSGTVGGLAARRLGLPRPEILRRFQPGEPACLGPVLTGGAGRLGKELAAVLESAQAETPAPSSVFSPGSLVFDATGITDTAQLSELYEFFHPRIRSLRQCGRVLILGTPPATAATPREAVAQKAIEGFLRSVGKELRRGATANLLQVTPEAHDSIESAVRFLLSARSAYVSGQALKIGTVPASGSDGHPTALDPTWSWGKPLAGRTAVVTGAARGIGAVIAQTLARDGAFVLCVDVPGQSAALTDVAANVRGEALELDITSPTAADTLAARLDRQNLGGIDVFVHNAGVTRDKTLGRMERAQWDTVLDVNLRAVENLTAALLEPAGALLSPGGRIVCTSSINGIAGAAGQTNYAAGKAGLIGLVEALAPRAADQLGGTVNAVAPGFIETQMTAAVPLFVREAGRRLNSLRQGGQPIDVAEAVAFLAAPGSGHINGQTLRVCGQSLLGA